jgi:murein DD-endopeptidase MepM/ murein hydrolase activator NlpD
MGERGIVYFEIELEAQIRPRELAHRIGYRAARAGGVVDAQVEGARVAIGASPLPAFGAPVRGGPWAAVYGPWWERGHRRVVYTVDGRARIPGRFAIDFIKLDGDGRRARDGGDWLRDEHGYAEDVLAVADGVVAVALDGYPERVQPDQPHPKKSLVDAAGNYVVLDIGDGRHVFYEHLMPGSVRVKPGERVRRGQVLASLGSTGDSSKPHLHFHVADGVSTLAAEGLPFELREFRVLGRYEDVDTLGKAAWQALGASEPRERAGEMPAPNTVVEFGD